MYVLFGIAIYISHSVGVARLGSCVCVRERVCVRVDLHGSSIQHLALSLRALFQDEDGFLSV